MVTCISRTRDRFDTFSLNQRDIRELPKYSHFIFSKSKPHLFAPGRPDPSMEISMKIQETQNPSLINSHGFNSPTSNGFNTRSEPNNPYPTTFVQADTSSFKQVVQMLTGSAETTRMASRPDPVRSSIPPIKTGTRKDKLFERRNSLKNLKISPLCPGMVNGRPGFLSGYSGSPRNGTPEILSPSILDFPSLVLSPITPLIPDPFNRGTGTNSCDSSLNMEAEDKAIKEKGFYMHPSPVNTPRDSEPKLLPLFPLTSHPNGVDS